MGAFRDRYGYELSTTSATAAEAYSRGVDCSLSGDLGAEQAMATAIAEDGGFALAHVAAARLAQFIGDFATAKAAKERAQELAPGTTPRERLHIAAMARAIEGDSAGSVALIRELVAEYPRDAYLLSQATGPFSLIGFGGGPDWRAESFALLEPLAGAYGDDWWFASTFAFAHNELFHFEEARRLAEISLRGRPRSGHGSHTMAHVFFETGDHPGGARFLDAWMPGYERAATLFSHLSWHQALFALANGDPGAALRIYDETLKPSICPGVPIITIADAASLIWRCDLYGVARPTALAADLSAWASTAFPRPGVTFADMHVALAHAAAGDGESLERLAAALRQREAEGKQSAGPVALATVEAIAAFSRGEYAAAVDRLEPLTGELVRIGGSNAQRQVFEDTLLEAYLRAGRYTEAEKALRARLQRRPSEREERLLARAAAAPAVAG
jgi:tetratricopeptide (TPR) repeat protein